MPPLSAYAVTAPGLEALTAAELTALGVETGDIEPGGVPFSSDQSGLYRANLELRTASRVLLRLGTFRAVAFNELEKQGRRLPWPSLLAPGAVVEFRVTCRKSRLYHDGAVAERFERILAEQLPGIRVGKPAGPGDDESSGAGSQLIVVRLFRDRCTVSLDSSGALLHRRGYRLDAGKAPLRETLAAAMLLAAEWDPASPLIDPMCGSGTIPIEAALIARRIPPGWRRGFAFERWPDFDPGLWSRIRAEADGRISPAAPASVIGSDRDEGAVESAISNAERAGVASDISFRRAAVSGLEVPPVPGWLVTNPPYGARVGERNRLRDLYAQLGNVARRRLPGWRLALLSAHPMLEGHTGLELTERLAFSNGGIRVRMMAGVVR